MGLFTSSQGSLLSDAKYFVAGVDVQGEWKQFISEITSHYNTSSSITNQASLDIFMNFDYSFGLGWAAVIMIFLSTLFMLHSLHEKLIRASKQEHTVAV